MFDDLKRKVYEANILLSKSNLVVLSWGNVSQIDRKLNVVAIKPSGVDYSKMQVDDIVVVDMDGNIVDGKLRPSVDLDTHLELYKAFKDIQGVTHTHSNFATSFAQCEKEIPCLGTTHADTFNGPILCTRILSEEEVNTDYAKNTGTVIIERFKNENPMENPGVLVAKHGVFTWGKDATDSVKNAIVIEECARMAYQSFMIDKNVSSLPEYILKAHYNRKHGKNKTYGQEVG